MSQSVSQLGQIIKNLLSIQNDFEIQEAALKLQIKELEEQKRDLQQYNEDLENENQILKKQLNTITELIEQKKFPKDMIKSLKQISMPQLTKPNFSAKKFEDFIKQAKIDDLITKVSKTGISSESQSILSQDIKQDNFEPLYCHLDVCRQVQYYRFQGRDLLFSIGEDSLLMIYDIKNEQQKIIRSHISPMFSLHLSINNAFTGACEGCIKAWEMENLLAEENPKPLDYFLFKEVVYSIDVNKKNPNLLLGSSADKVTKMYDIYNDEVLLELNKSSYSQFHPTNPSQIIQIHDSLPIITVQDFERDQFYEKNFGGNNLLIKIISAGSNLTGVFNNKIIQFNQNFDIIKQLPVEDNSTDLIYENEYRYFVSGKKGVFYYDTRKDGLIKKYQFGSVKYEENITSLSINQIQQILYASSADGYIFFYKI